MKAFITVLWLASNLATGAVFAQTMPPNDAGVTMGHWHLNSRDIEANKKIFVAHGRHVAADARGALRAS